MSRRNFVSSCRSGSPYCSNETGRSYHGEWDLCADCEDAEANVPKDCDHCGEVEPDHLPGCGKGPAPILGPDDPGDSMEEQC